MQISAFAVDVTPPLGSPVAYKPARTIEDPLSARGIILVPGAQKPIALCAIDWLGIANESYDLFLESLGQGADSDRVSIHALHQHDAPRLDATAEQLLADRGYGGLRYDMRFARDVAQRMERTIREQSKSLKRVTHIGVGKAKVQKIASNRRILR